VECLDGQRFSPEKHDGLDQTSIHAILDDGDGHLWLPPAMGLRAATARARAMRCKGQAARTGLNLAPRTGCAAERQRPTAIRRVALGRRTPVVCHVQRIVEVDPAHFPVNNVPPPVALERFAVDDLPQALACGGFRFTDSGGSCSIFNSIMRG